MIKRSLIVAAITAQCFLVHPALAESVKFDIVEFSVEGNSLLPVSDVLNVLTPFVGSNREMSDVNKAAEALRAEYQKAGYSVVQVIAPVQTITSGKVLLKVVEDKIVSVEVKGNSAYDANNIRASLPSLQIGKSLNANELESAIVLANENAAKQVAVNIQPGEKLGDILARIDVNEDRPVKLIATYDNAGSSATGFNRIGLAYQNANMFNLDHSLTVQYNGTLDMIDKVYSFSVGYHMPFYQDGLSADLIAAYSSSSGQNVNLYFAGKGTVLGARLNWPLANMGIVRHKLILGADYKDSKSISGPMQTPITEMPVSLTYYAQAASAAFQGNGSVSVVTNMQGGQHGAVNDYYNPATGRGARVPVAGTATPRVAWNAWRVNGSGGFSLPLDWQARVGVNGQYSKDLLLPSEQFGAGGATSVRGYPERIISGDVGYTVNLELYTPEHRYMKDSMRALLFWDLGSVSLNDAPLPVFIPKTTRISGIGIGFRVVHDKDVNLKADVGWAQKQVSSGPVTVYKGDIYGNISLSSVF